jgi:thiol-disulfide isomerase/thioredoxin
LIFFKKLVDHYGRLYADFPIKSYVSKVDNIESVKKAEIFIHDLKKLRINFLDSFAKKSPLSSDFSKLALNTIESAAFKDSLTLYWYNKGLLMNGGFYSSFLDEKLKTVKSLEFQPYPVYEDAVLALLSMRTTPYLAYQIKSQSDFINRFNTIEKEFDGILKEFLLSNTIVSSFNKGINIPPDFIKKFEKQTKDKFYKQVVKELSKSLKKDIPVDDFDKLVSVDGHTTIDINGLIAKNKGKVVILDFWASWCLPCREEFPASRFLKNYFKNDTVSFIYLSEDKDIGKWKKVIQEEDLDIDENFLFLDTDNSTFRKRFNITTIPRYIVINKDGQVVNSDAPRPSNPQLSVIIKKYLEK